VSPLVEYFRGEGYADFGWYGDTMEWSPEETAIHFLKEGQALRRGTRFFDDMEEGDVFVVQRSKSGTFNVLRLRETGDVDVVQQVDMTDKARNPTR
jgi:hypothetical protein